MKVGDLVRYRGWGKNEDPLAIVVYETQTGSSFHHRIRVMWVGKEIPVQASVLSSKNSRVTTWVNPKYFEVVSTAVNL